MNKLIPLKTASQSLAYLISPSPWCRGLRLIIIACFGALLTAQAAPDGDVGHGSTAEGTGALSSLTSGLYNTALGLQALFNDTTGGYNTGTGVNALYNNTGGTSNTATGVNALYSNTTASYNTANGVNALYSNTTGTYNTATGQNALYSNTTGTRNTANGDYALLTNTTGSSNTAIGVGTMFSNTTGSQNTANGANALYNNTTGYYNTATGLSALYHNTTGGNNTANGDYALYSNTTGFNNIGLGYFAGLLLTTGSNNIDIGNSAVAAEANTIRIGSGQSATYISGISGATASGGAAVFVNSNGQLGTATSSRRFKQEIKPMEKASEAILALRPVTFRYKREIDPKSIPQFGLVAEEVEQVNPDLVVRDAEGKVYTVRYEAVNAMLLNEFLKEHSKVQTLEATTEQLKQQVEVLTAGLQKVSDQLEASKAAPHLVVTN
jgi:Chaperone of endosialidase